MLASSAWDLCSDSAKLPSFSFSCSIRRLFHPSASKQALGSAGASLPLSLFLAVRSMATKPSTASPLLSLPFPSVPYPILKEHTHYTMHGISFKLNFARYYRPIRRVTSDVELNVVVGRRCLCVNVASVLSRRCCCCCCWSSSSYYSHPSKEKEGERGLILNWQADWGRANTQTNSAQTNLQLIVLGLAAAFASEQCVRVCPIAALHFTSKKEEEKDFLWPCECWRTQGSIAAGDNALHWKCCCCCQIYYRLVQGCAWI